MTLFQSSYQGVMSSVIKMILGLMLITLCNSYIMRDYNYVHTTDYSTRAELEAALFVPEDSDIEVPGARKFILLGVAENSCWDDLSNPLFRGISYMGFGNAVAVATLPASEFILGLKTTCSELFWYAPRTELNFPISRHSNISTVKNWLSNHNSIYFTMENGFDFAVDLYVEAETPNGRSLIGTLSPGSRKSLNCVLGQSFSFRVSTGSALTGDVVDFIISDGRRLYVAKSENYIVCGAENSSLSTCSSNDVELKLRDALYRHYDAICSATVFVQAQVVKAITKDGFKKGKLPQETFRWLKEWFYLNKANAQVENRVGVALNQNESTVYYTSLPYALVARLDQELKPLMQQWYGGPDNLILTSTCGIRSYTNGSKLRMHVDKILTHVISAIINVDQDVDKPWPLKILSHDDIENELVMEPGDMLYYESAKLLHGRPDPMIGRHYDNIFIHYRPELLWLNHTNFEYFAAASDRDANFDYLDNLRKLETATVGA